MKFCRSVYLSIVLIIVDRLIKIIAVKGLLGEWSFFGFYPRLILHKNFGIAFDLTVPHFLIIGSTMVFIIILIILLLGSYSKDKHLCAGLIFIISGAASNLADRLTNGFVVDYLEILPGSIWNIADIMILAGFVMIMLKSERKNLIKK